MSKSLTLPGRWAALFSLFASVSFLIGSARPDRHAETLQVERPFSDRKDALSLEDLDGSGADWLNELKPYIQDNETVVVSPHKVYGPETNDLALQLRKRGIDKVILAGMSANLCVESHLRELLEQGFEVMVVSDATAAARVPEGDGYETALVNFRYLANTVRNTDEATQAIANAL